MGRYLINTLNKKMMKQGITLIITVSKETLLDFFFDAFDKMDLPRENMHLLVYDNTDSVTLASRLIYEVDKRDNQFLSVRLYKSYMKARGTVTGTGNEIFSRSKNFNIWSMWKKIYWMVYTEDFFQLEDDGIYPIDTFHRLNSTFKKDPKIAFVTGIEVGRTFQIHQPVRCGVHRMKFRGDLLLERHSLNPNTKGVVPIDGSGVYCFIADTKAYQDAFDGFEAGAVMSSLFSMDNGLTYNLKQHGWKLYADFNVWCIHLQPLGDRVALFGKEQALELVDIWVPQFNNWAVGIKVRNKNSPSKHETAPCIYLDPNRQKEELEIRKQIREAKKKQKEKQKEEQKEENGNRNQE